MRTFGGLFAELCSPAHLHAALRSTVRGKRRQPDVAWLLFTADDTVHRLAAALASGRWEPSPFRRFVIRDPKARLIAFAPVEDRVVHTAIGALIDRVWAPRLLPNDQACRIGFGTHRARLALQRGMRDHRFCLHLDVRAYFPSVHLGILRDVLRVRIRDRAFLGTLDRLLEAGSGLIDPPEVRSALGIPEDWPPPGRGLPIGAYTSQILATHVNLCDLDHAVKRSLRAPGYVRYVDDLFLFGDRRADLRRWRAEVGRWLWDERELRLKRPNAPVLSCGGSLYGLGARITRSALSPTDGSLRDLARRARSAQDAAGLRSVAGTVRHAAG